MNGDSAAVNTAELLIRHGADIHAVDDVSPHLVGNYSMTGKLLDTNLNAFAIEWIHSSYSCKCDGSLIVHGTPSQPWR